MKSQPIMHIDHLIISVTNFKKSVAFYSSFLGKAKISKWDAHWIIDNTKFFITFPYKDRPRKFDKHNIGLNHIAFRASSLAELKRYQSKLNKAKIKNSGISIDQYSNKEFIWFDDPDGLRLEFYLR